ncbi:MAG: hypothetical protein JWM91_5021, partial [Rhodospirillales bacterium]|nr:hypothetical protein [Rhodospirillales bacterium]
KQRETLMIYILLTFHAKNKIDAALPTSP